jgi:hypothetical protein
MSPEENEQDRGSRWQAPGGRYSTFVGIAFLVLIGIAALNTFGDDEGGVLGGEANPGRGHAVAQFAVPDIRGSLDGDANVAQDDCETSENPCPADKARTPACKIELEGAIRVCDLFDRPLVISTWFTRAADCLPTNDAVDRVATGYRGRVNFLSLNSGDDRAEVERIVDERGWTMPVGWDRDGTVSTVLGVGGCPTLLFVFPGGIIQSVGIGAEELSESEITRRVDTLVAESRRRGPG